MLITVASLQFLWRAESPKRSIQNHVIRDLHSAANHERRRECQVLHDQARDAGADRPKQVACQVGEATGKRPFIWQNHRRNVGLSRGNVHLDERFAAKK